MARQLINRAAGAFVVSLQRAVADAWPIIQSTLAATVAWVIARYVFDHPQPFFAPIAAVVALNTSLGERGLNAIRLLQGVFLGIVVGELTLFLLGESVGALAFAVFVSIFLARALGGARITLAQAAASAILIVALPDIDAGADRFADALIGAGVALFFTQFLFSPEPVRLLRRAEAAALAGMARGLGLAARALADDDDALAEEAIRGLRAQRDELSELNRLRHASTRVARRSVIWRAQLAPAVKEKENAGHLDLLGGSCLVLARTAAALSSGERASLAPHVRELAQALEELGSGLGVQAARQRAADRGLGVAVEISAEGAPSDSALAAAVMSVRMVATDLLVFAGMEHEDALAAVQEGIEARRVPPPPKAARDFSWRRWLRMPFSRKG